MPKYKNIGNEPIAILDKHWKMGDELELEFYINPKEYPNLKMTDPNPKYDPIVFSSLCSSGSKFDVTKNLTPEACLIRLVSKDQISSVTFNGNSNVVYIPQSHPIELKPVHKFDLIEVKSGSVSIEIWKPYTFRG